MSKWNDKPLTFLVSRLSSVSPAERQAILDGPSDAEYHREHFDRLDVLRQIETGGTARHTLAPSAARVLAWNVERLRHIDAIAATLDRYRPDVSLLCEIDRGMARTENSDRIADLAERRGEAYLYAVEFVELGLGDLREQAQHAGETNSDGFHGAGLLSACTMAAPFLIRIDDRGDWFDGVRHERRVGGTIAIGASVMVGGTPVVMVSVHLESHCDAATRGEDMRRMLRLIDQAAAGQPVLLGGDFNTSTASIHERRDDREAWLRRVAEEPGRLTEPEHWEPLFGIAAEFGYDWTRCNVPHQTTVRYPEGDQRPKSKIDWIFTRGLIASDPMIIPALRPDGTPSSDHEALMVTISPLGGQRD